ncbi:MAG: hypothetical protein NVS1B13_09000 [Flavisolibacter sp.]
MILLKSTVTNIINGATGGNTTLTNGSQVQISPNSLVDKSNQPYSGPVNMSVQYLDPTTAGFGSAVPGGDMLAQRTDQSTSILYSYGLLEVKLSTASGGDLQLAAGKSSNLVLSIPDELTTTAPPTIPLWYFDEFKGIWKEEGVATKQGSKYIGTVNHFSSWNFDHPQDLAMIVGKLVDCKNQPGWGMISFGQLSLDMKNYTIEASTETDPRGGRFSQIVPAGRQLSIVIFNPLFLTPLDHSKEGKGKLTVYVPPLAKGQVYDVGTLKIVPCPAKIKGKFKIKRGDHLRNISFSTSLGGYINIDNPNSDFSMDGLPPNTSIIMTASTSSGLNYNKTFTSPGEGQELDLGEIKVSTGAFITGKLFCKKDPIVGGEISAHFSNGTSPIVWEYTDTTGQFYMSVDLNETIQLTIRTNQGTIEKTVNTGSIIGSVIDIGNIDFCTAPDIGENSFVINGDGFINATNVIQAIPYPNSVSIYSNYNNTTGIQIADVPDTLRFGVSFMGKSIGTYGAIENAGAFIQWHTGSKIINYWAGYGIYTNSKIEIIVTKYDSVGGLVEGTFSGTFISDKGVIVTVTKGKFSVIRSPDI